VVGWHPLKSKRVVKQEHSDTGGGTFGEHLPERVGDLAALAVVQLQRDRLTRGPKIVPQPGVRAIAIQGDLNLVRRKQYGPGEHGDAERKLGLARRHRRAVGPDPLDMPNGSTTRYMLDTDERGKRDDADERPTANPRESVAHRCPDAWDDRRGFRGGGSHVWP
jgi:hypothetical protein